MKAASSLSERSLVFRLLDAYCQRNGLSLCAADDRGHAGQIRDQAGRVWSFVGTRFDLNPFGAAEIAKDKTYTAWTLSQCGIPVPESCFVDSSQWAPSQGLPERVKAFCFRIGLPLFVKPNSGKEGKGVHRVYTQGELLPVLKTVCAEYGKGLVQQAVPGRDVRVLVLDGEVLGAFERVAPHLTGDGQSSVQDLSEKQAQVDLSDERIACELAAQGMTIDSVPEAGKTIRLLPVSNLTSGGAARIVTEELPQSVLDLAIASVRTLGLRYAGVDLIVASEEQIAPGAMVLEVNAAPGLSNFHRQGPEEAGLVEAIYERVFTALFKS